jgi:hypothetical protein
LYDLTVVIPVKRPPNIKQFINEMEWLLTSHPLIVVDSGGGDELRKYALKYFLEPLHMWEARKLGINHVETPLTLNLDVDAVISPEYLSNGVKVIKEDKAEAVTTCYSTFPQHYGFGYSIWKTEWLQQLYDYSPKHSKGLCECEYMWRKLKDAGGRLETLPYRAKHLKP